jgi:hypothetical protein
LVFVTCGSDCNRSWFHWILALGRKRNGEGTIKFSCSTVSTMFPSELRSFQVDGYLPRATTMSPPALRGPLLQVSGLVAQAA